MRNETRLDNLMKKMKKSIFPSFALRILCSNMTITQKICENTSKFPMIVFNAVGIQIFKKTNVPSILHAHKTKWGENISEA